MSRLKLDNINFDNDDFVVSISKQNTYTHDVGQKDSATKQEDVEITEFEEEQKRLQEKIEEAKQIILKAQQEASEILLNAKAEVSELVSKTNQDLDDEKIKILEEAKKNADDLLAQASETSQKEAQELIEKSKNEIEQARIKATNEGYNEGYKDGQEKIQEELEEKIEKFNKFCQNQYEIKEKIIKSASKDILDLIINISKKVLLKEVDAQTIDKIIKNAVNLLEKKENINIILSEKYAKLLFELQNKAINDEIEFKFEDFKQYDGFEIIYNPKFDDDTIIIENLKERFDASISVQLDVLIRNIYEKSQNGQIEVEEYIEKNEAE